MEGERVSRGNMDTLAKVFSLLQKGQVIHIFF
jgi:hypothetical protein